MSSFGPSNAEDIYKWNVVEAYFQLLPAAYFSVDNLRRTVPAWPQASAQRALLHLLDPCSHPFLTKSVEDVVEYQPPLSYRKAIFRLLEKQVQSLEYRQVNNNVSEEGDSEEEEEVYADEFVEHCMALLDENIYRVPSSAVELYGDQHEDAEHIGYASYAVPFYAVQGAAGDQTRSHRIPICIKKTFTQVGTKVWGAGLFLAELFQYMTFPQNSSPSSVWRNKRVLELGAGVGITGILIGRGLPVELQPKAVIMTDCFEEVVNILQHNIACLPPSTEDNELCDLVGDTIDWSTVTVEQIHSYEADCLIAADCTYSEDLNVLLISLFQLYLCERRRHDETTRKTGAELSQVVEQQTVFLPAYLLHHKIPFVLIACTIRHPDTFEHFVTNLYATNSLHVFDVSEAAHAIIRQPLYEYDFRSNIRLFCILAKSE